MSKKKKKGFSFNAENLIQFAWEKKVPLIIVSVIAAGVSIVVALTITPLFKSSVVMFPAPATSVSKYLLSDQYAGRQGLLSFGEEEQAEQLLQVLNSDHIQSRIIQKYDLMKHYDIDPESKIKYTTLRLKYNSRITYRRTKFMSVIVEVLDQSPDTAAMIANDIAALVDSSMNIIQRERAMVAYQLVHDEYFGLQREIKELEDSLNYLRRLGIFDYEAQSEVISAEYAKAISEGNEQGRKMLEKKLDILAKFGGNYISIMEFLIFEKERLSDLKAKYAEAKVDAEQKLPNKYVVDYAYPAERKSYPHRSMIVMASTASAFGFAYVLLLIIEIFRRRIKKK